MTRQPTGAAPADALAVYDTLTLQLAHIAALASLVEEVSHAHGAHPEAFTGTNCLDGGLEAVGIVLQEKTDRVRNLAAQLLQAAQVRA